MCGIEAQTQHHIYAWQTSTSPPNPSPQFCRWAVRAWDGPEAVSQNCLSLSEYMSFTHSWHQYHCNVYSPMGRTSRARVLGVLATGLLQFLYQSPAFSSAFRLLPSFRAQAWFLSQNLKDRGLSIVTPATLQLTSELQDHLCSSWWSICFGKRRSCYATQGGLESMILLPQCPGCWDSHVPSYLPWQVGLQSQRKKGSLQDSIQVFWWVLRKVVWHCTCFST